MPSFRAASKQSKWAAAQLAAHGVSRAETRRDHRLSSVGTERSYRGSLKKFTDWLQAEKTGADLGTATTEHARAWLEQRAEEVAQKTLDRDRQSLNMWYQHRGEPLDAKKSDYQSQVDRRGLGDQSRVYSNQQIDAIAERQQDKHAIATRIASEAGLRASELATIARPDEQPRSPGRPWRDDRFTGREATERYTVVGKGGLIREVALSKETAAQLESRRLAEPRQVKDREISRMLRYEIGFGQAWSQNFSDCSQSVTGWSAGAHAVRHVYAQERIEELQQRGYGYDDARAVTAQELGHWKAETTESYLR